MYDDLLPNLDYEFIDDNGTRIYEDVEDEEEESYLKDVAFLASNCIRPTIVDAYGNLIHIFFACLAFRALAWCLKTRDPLHHLTSTAAGIYVLYVVFEFNAVFTVILALGGCALIKISRIFGRNETRPHLVIIVILIYLITAECGLIKYAIWETIRGPQMVMCMKIVSYAFDLQGSPKKFNAFYFLGYVLCPGTLVFGPWVPFSDYVAAFHNDDWDFKWVRKILSSFIKSVFFFTLSVCLLEWIIPETSGPASLMYGDAMLFRVGHYFVSFVSETSATIAGFPKTEVTLPWAIEFPHSLVQVVVYWNLPIHRWLKTYVFKTTLQAGTFVAVMSTYFVSALLHGANTKLSAILLSLGLYTYVEYSLRKKISDKLSACVGARPCSKPCLAHRHRPANNILIHTINLFFTFLAIFHLSYLGCIAYSSDTSVYNPFHRWSDWFYISHLVAAATYGINAFLAVRW